MKAAIVQPNYIPWRGYFDLIDDVDVFVFYDDAQYTKRDWRNRNMIKTADGTMWLTVPVKNQERVLKINQTGIDYGTAWIENHVENIRRWYSRAPHYAQYARSFGELIERPYGSISEMDIALCRWIMEVLGIKTRICLSSELSAHGSRTEKLINILKALGATTYLSGPSARGYIDGSLFIENKICLEYKAYDYGPYPQLWGDFVGSVSVLDMIFNAGSDARKHLKSRSANEVAAA